ncbi:hypothetical protein U6B65_14970 (plasmid) [Oscillospiraceae bacterium MB08-C2-2]|nr:hypothetical protein U6B65_14970 [Oscillospiraceae bacterium MB08-C2-2]
MSITKLTLSKASKLIKRELGISGTTLVKPPEMNGNAKYPWYCMKSGNLSIEIYTTDPQDGKIINLHLTFRDGLGSIHRYFYADDLTEATEYMEGRQWEDLFEQVEGKSREPMIYHLARQAREACQKHFGGSNI